MNLRTFLIAGGVLALSACGGGGSDQTADFSTWIEAEVFYTYPYQGQLDVSPHAPVVVRFSESVEVEENNFTLQGPDGPVPFTVELIDGGLSAVLTPSTALPVKSDYTLTLNDIRTENGEPSLPDDELTFTTRPALKGPLALRESSEEFLVLRVNPGDEVPFLDFSSVNLLMSQPVDPDSLVYGQSISLTQNGELVPATLLVDGRHITLDPRAGTDDQGEPTDPVEPDVTLTLTLDNTVRSLGGDTLPAYTREFMPKNTKPRSTLVQEAAPADPQLGCLDDGVRTSPITGDGINCVPLIARLLGGDTASKQQGNVFAELAYAPDFPEQTPLRIPRGSLLQGDPLEVNIGGAVPAGFDSGDVTVTFLSDANGYLLPNPYSDDPGAPKLLRLTMDVAFDTKTQKANGAFNQNLLQVELVGYAITDLKSGRLVADAVGVVEPEVLGVEHAYGVLSFHMESYADQPDAPQPPVDMTSPELATWLPGDEVDKQRPGDPIVLTFSEPLDPHSIEAGTNLTLTADGAAEPFDYYLDGVTIVIQPEQPLRYDTHYVASFTDGITDVAGNPALPASVDFTLPVFEGGGHPMIATTTYPGFPCAADRSTWDIASGDHGRCLGGENDDDHLPVTPMPAQRRVEVQFSQAVNENSVVLGQSCETGSFRVERIADAGQAPQPNGDGYVCQSVVPGTLETNGRTVTFVPERPWQEGATYRYVLATGGDDFDAALCQSAGAVCSRTDGPLQTATLTAPEPDESGPDLEIYFTGAPADDKVFQVMRNLPTNDINADFLHQDSEPQPQEQPPGSGEYPPPPNSNELYVASTGGLLLNAQVGCDLGESCPSDKFLHVTGALDVELVGYDPEEDAVRVNVYPTQLMTSSVDVYAELGLSFFDLFDLPILNQVIETGSQVMRIRYEDRGEGRIEPVTGWIRETPDGPEFETNLDIYLSAPYLAPEALGIPLSHDLYSYPLSLRLVGAVTFLEDGRLQIEQHSTAPQTIDTTISFDPGGALQAAQMTLGIEEGGIFLNYVSTPIKN